MLTSGVFGSTWDMRKLQDCSAYLDDVDVATNCCIQFLSCVGDTECATCITAVGELSDGEFCDTIAEATSFDDLTMDFCGVDEPLLTSFIECTSEYKYGVNGTDTAAFEEFQAIQAEEECDDGAMSMAFGSVVVLGLATAFFGL